MRYLLDTHTAIWALEDKEKLSETAKMIMDDVSLPLYVSIVSAWEIAIKISIGKLKFEGGSRLFLEKMQQNGVGVLDVNISHINHVESLPFFHRDPFDRLLVSSAIVEDMIIITTDENIQKYSTPCVW